MKDKQSASPLKAEAGIPIPATTTSSLKRSRFTRAGRILLIAFVLFLWVWVLRKRPLGLLSTHLPEEDAFLTWPFAVDRPPKHGHRWIPNGKPAEKIFLTVPNHESAILTSRKFATKPHMAGTPQDYVTAIDFLHLLQKELGIPKAVIDPVFSAGSVESRNATLSITEADKPSAWVDVYYPVMNTPLDRSLEILDDDGTVAWKADLEEVTENILDPEAGKYATAVPTFHGLSRGGEVQGKVVYVNYGRKQDYDALEAAGVNFTGTIAIARYGGIFRGLKVKGAQERGAVGCLIYSDPRDDGSVTTDNGYAAYPYGPARNPTSVQRGSVQFISSYPGDPTTPGYPSYENSTRTLGENIPGIPSLPISWSTAQRLLQELAEDGQNRTVKLVNHVNDRVIPIWNTMGVIPGHIKNEIVVVGNHRDAWVMGATDPTSGTVSTYEVVRGLGVLLRKGWRPLRTIVLASWDAEEYGLIGSTEWGEDFEDWIKDHVVAYLNLDSSVSGSRFGLNASPSLAHLMRNAALDIPHPTIPGRSLWQARLDRGPLYGQVDEEALKVWEEQYGVPVVEAEDFALDSESGQLASVVAHQDSLLTEVRAGAKLDANGVRVSSASTGVTPLGSGSDYTVFLQRIGIASSNIGFGSTLSDPVYHYHSVFDSEAWQERFGDPGFPRHVAVAKHLGLQLLRIVDAIILPFNTSQYALELDSYLTKVEDIADSEGFDTDFSSLRTSISTLQEASKSLDAEKVAAEKNFKKILWKWRRAHHWHGHGKMWFKLHGLFRKLASWLHIGKPESREECPHKAHLHKALEHKHGNDLEASSMVKVRVGRYPAWAKEQREMSEAWDFEREHHVRQFNLPWHHKPGLGKKLIEAAKRVQAVNQKLVAFEKGFISQGGIKDREWYRHLGVAPGKWLGYGATTFPALTESLTFDKNVTLAKKEAGRLEALINSLADTIRV